METKEEATQAGKFNFVYRLSIYFFITKLISISIQIIDDELTRLSASTSESARGKYFSIKICFSGNEARKKMESDTYVTMMKHQQTLNECIMKWTLLILFANNLRSVLMKGETVMRNRYF